MANKTGNVVTSFKDDTYAFVSVRVDEGGSAGAVEYLAQTPLKDTDNNDKTAEQIEKDLLEEISRQRNAQIVTTQDFGMSGTVILPEMKDDG